jgi:signal peptidase I
MPKKKPTTPPPRGGSGPAGSRSEPRKHSDRKGSGGKPGGWQSWFSPGAIREMVEAVVIAFALAFFVRTFEAEAFVIPTGSMAPTLMGRHKDVTCAKCGYPFQVTASGEVDARTGRPTNQEVVAGTCPICRFTMDLAPGNPQGKTYRSFKGDRILVGKFPYQLADPKRWDVAVFMYPGEARTNYIKRLVGLPSETLLIRRGDLFVKRSGEDRFTMARKSPPKIVATMQPVYDNDYVVPEMVRLGWPLRWVAEPEADRAGAWQSSEDFKSFRTDGAAEGEAWLDYQHFVPTYDDWKAVIRKQKFPPGYAKAQLITDFTAYNTEYARPKTPEGWFPEEGSLGMGPPPNPARLGLHWVGELALESTLRVDSAQGTFLMALVEGGRIFRCELDVATGRATLFVDGAKPFQTAAETRVRGKGTYDLRFANVDDQLVLWVNGHVVQFDPQPEYQPRVESGPKEGGLDAPRRDAPGESLVGPDPVPSEADLKPARIGSRDLAATVSHLRLFRDVYYIAQRHNSRRSTTVMSDYEFSGPSSELSQGESAPDSAAGLTALSSESAESFARQTLSSPTPQSLAVLFSDPKLWTFFRYRQEVSFTIGADQFLMLGDNSAESKDSRLWEGDDDTPFYVARDLLKGKALWIYWPHSWDRIPGSDRIGWFPNGIWLPLFPNFSRMGFVR